MGYYDGIRWHISRVFAFCVENNSIRVHHPIVLLNVITNMFYLSFNMHVLKIITSTSFRYF